MIAAVKAGSSNGVFTRLEPMDFEEGSEVTVSIDDSPPPRPCLAGIADSVKRQEASPLETREDLPVDLAINKRHYLYGHLNEEGE